MTNFGIDTLKQGTASWGIELSSGQLAQFQHYAELIHEWNQRTNLTSVEPPEFGTRHFLDSVSILTLPEFAEVRTLVDVGSGAGLPGLAIKIAKPHLEIVLIESQTKRVAFLKRAIMELGLAGVAVQHGRVERICQSATTLSARFDCAVARAVASLAELHAWAA
ncbi:MAG: 16S rRNA (guanine(527)-N(7))-methyltransferase RsmG, partial [Proteobacteria bacterium]